MSSLPEAYQRLCLKIPIVRLLTRMTEEIDCCYSDIHKGKAVWLKDGITNQDEVQLKGPQLKSLAKVWVTTATGSNTTCTAAADSCCRSLTLLSSRRHQVTQQRTSSGSAAS